MRKYGQDQKNLYDRFEEHQKVTGCADRYLSLGSLKIVMGKTKFKIIITQNPINHTKSKLQVTHHLHRVTLAKTPQHTRTRHEDTTKAHPRTEEVGKATVVEGSNRWKEERRRDGKT